MITMQGPFSLKQGGTGIAIRNPVYLEQKNGERTFWGFTIVIIRVPDIMDDDRRKNAELFEEAFYEKKNLDPQMHVQQENNNTVADEVDPELLAKVLANPEMRALLNSLAKTMK